MAQSETHSGPDGGRATFDGWHGSMKPGKCALMPTAAGFFRWNAATRLPDFPCRSHA
jgi:hypothetical protein